MVCVGSPPKIRSAPLIRPERFPKREPPPLFCLRGLDFPPLIDNPTVLTLANWQPNGLLTPYGPRFCPQVVDALGLLHNFPAKSMIPIDRGEGVPHSCQKVNSLRERESVGETSRFLTRLASRSSASDFARHDKLSSYSPTRKVCFATGTRTRDLALATRLRPAFSQAGSTLLESARR